jgi:hypothetical protein
LDDLVEALGGFLGGDAILEVFSHPCLYQTSYHGQPRYDHDWNSAGLTVDGNHCNTGRLKVISPMGDETIYRSPGNVLALGYSHQDGTDFEIA